jgi:hypothetical protein
VADDAEEEDDDDEVVEEEVVVRGTAAITECPSRCES